MKLFIISVGKKHDEMMREGIVEFEKRISAYYELEWRIIPSSSEQEEGRKILESVKDGDVLVVLDEKGKELSTKEFGEAIQKNLNSGIKRLVFVIGGAYGLSPEVISKAHILWSLSRLTFPHQLVRLILVEQIYRAISILNGSKYHHE